MSSKPAESPLFGRKFRQSLWGGVGAIGLLLGSSPFYVSAEEESPNLATEEADCVRDAETGYWTGEDIYTQCDPRAESPSEDATEDASEDKWDLGGDRYSADEEALTEEDEAVLMSLSDAEAEEVATLFDEEDYEEDTVEVGSTASEEVAAEETAPAQDDTGMGLGDGGADMAAAPEEEAEATPADSGDADSFDSAAVGSNGADTTGTIQGTGSLVALGVGEGLSNAINDPTSLDSVADVVVGTDPNGGSKENVVQVTALGGVTDGHLAVTVLEGLDGDTTDPAAQVLAVDADNAPSGPAATPPIDGVAEVNVGRDPDGQSFNVVQLDVADESLAPHGGNLVNIAVADGLDDGFGSLAGISIGGQNNGEHDNLADIALGPSFDPLADPLSPLTGGVNDLGVALGAGLAPVLGPLGAALP